MLSLGFTVCAKTAPPPPTVVVKHQDAESTEKALFGIIIRFKWTPDITAGEQLQNACAGGDCGNCLGICIRKSIEKERPLSGPEIEDGDGIAYVLLNEGLSALKLIPTRSCDIGDGIVRINEDWVWPSDVCAGLGVSQIVISKGDYEIDYSDTSEAFGHVWFSSVNISH